MKIFITSEQKIKLERLHDTTCDGQVRDRIKAILLASEGGEFRDDSPGIAAPSDHR